MFDHMTFKGSLGTFLRSQMIAGRMGVLCRRVSALQ